MNKKIIVYGLSNAQQSVLSATLPEQYEMLVADCVTDLITSNPICTIIDSTNMSEDALRVLLAYYMDVGDRLDETVVWLGNADVPKLPSFVRYDDFLQLALNIKEIMRKAQERYDIMAQYTDMYSYLPKHAIAECLEADFYTRVRRLIPPHPLKEARRIWQSVLELEYGPEFLAAICELCRWLQKQRIPFRISHGYLWQLFVLVFTMTEEGINPTAEEGFTIYVPQKEFSTVKKWLRHHWYFCEPDKRLCRKTVKGLETGLAALDLQILGMRPGEVILVGGRPAMGKTSFARGVQQHLSEQGKRVYYFDFIFDGKDVHRDFAEFESELRASNADLAVFDHFQFLNDYDKTDETVAHLFERIKSLATELCIPIMVLLHLNRNPETRPDPSPIESDIPHAKKILPCIDTVLLLYRRAYYDPVASRRSARCIILKAKRCKYKYKTLTPKWDDKNHRFTD